MPQFVNSEIWRNILAQKIVAGVFELVVVQDSDLKECRIFEIRGGSNSRFKLINLSTYLKNLVGEDCVAGLLKFVVTQDYDSKECHIF